MNLIKQKWYFDMNIFYSIADYTPLIQLLVGGLYLSDFFIDRKSFDLPQSIKATLKKSVDKSSSDTLRYLQQTNSVCGTSSSDEWNRKLCGSVMSVMSLYGCIVLFYCANCHTTESHAVIYSVSCTGPIISTIITMGYLVWSLCLYGHRSQDWHKWVKRSVFLGQCFVFLYFFCINPDVPFFGEEMLVRSIVNFSILVTMTLWFGHFIKKWILDEFLVPYWTELVEYTELFFHNTRPTEVELSDKANKLFQILRSEKGMGLKKKTRRLLKEAYIKNVNTPINTPQGLIISSKKICKGAKIIRKIAMYGGFADISTANGEK